MSYNHQVASGRAALAVEVVGSGDLVVLLHAGVCDRRMWHCQLDGVGASNKAIAYDRRGYGDTRGVEASFSAAEDLLAVVDATADGRPVILVACSEGVGSRLTRFSGIRRASVPWC